jgi:ubiquitin-conjugating enzyme E2 O
VQTYNPKQRIAEVLLLDTKEKEIVSVLELDTGGFGRVNYGVGLGQIVLLCADNGAEVPEVPSLGQVDPPDDGRDGFKAVLHSLGLDHGGGSPDQLSSSLPRGDPNAVKWWGEVVDMYLDGTISVELYSGEHVRVDIKKVIVLNEPEGPFPGDEFGDDYSDYTDGMSDRSWVTVAEEGMDQGLRAVNGEHTTALPDRHSQDQMDEMDVDDTDGASSVDREAVDMDMDDDESDHEATPAPPEPTATPRPPDSQEQPTAGPSVTAPVPRRQSLADSSKWLRFDILESAPAEHHYFTEPLLAPSSKVFYSRLRKEHRTLSTSLPENILVRTYEDRTDLMRVLIIGPEGTPYADAPFVFDLYLNPTTFPNEPPQVYFHSHTNGLGRCNPNLYEEGKVCLSVLGTWAGDKSESWSPTKSSLLQVFVSISGLVLVRSPYHCEPAFAKLEGTREGRVNSRLYSEKAYVLSRSFVRTALDRPPAGFEAELTHAYFTKGRLTSVIDHAQRLISQGEVDDDNEDEMDEMWNADAIGRLSMGAIITLKRTVAALEKIQARGPLPLPESSS